MGTSRVLHRVVPVVTAIVFLLPTAPARAGGQSAVPGPTVQGSPVPGMPAGMAEARSQRPVEITFTKWGNVVDGANLLVGVTGGDVTGVLAGQSLRSQLSYDQRINLIEAIYEVQAGPRSFTALIRGGRTTNPGDAILDGVILDGWRTGASVRVKFHRDPEATDPACASVPAGLACFYGTISVGRDPR